MSLVVIYAIIALVLTGLVAAVILYFVAQKFKVVEDPRIDTVSEVLPGANCGGCGLAGCRAFAEAIVSNESMEGLFCPVGGSGVMASVAAVLGMVAEKVTPKVAVIRCAGSCEKAPARVHYDGLRDCAFAHSTLSGISGCSYGCLGLGNCERVCAFDALYINEVTGLPVVDEEKCVACNACVKECPRHIIELRNKGPRDRRIFVSCVNKDKGGAAKKSCSVACIGCGKCFKACAFGAITIENNLSYIDFEKCKLCRKCVAECPTEAILEINFPLKKVPAAEPIERKPASTAKAVTPAPIPAEKATSPTPAETASTPIPAEKATPPTPTETASTPIPEEKVVPPTPAEMVSTPISAEKVAPPTPTETASTPISEEKVVLPTPAETASTSIPEEKVTPPTPTETASTPIPEEKVTPPTPTETASHPEESPQVSDKIETDVDKEQPTA